jgi:hypothetical protein
LFDFDFLGRNQTPRIDFAATADIHFPDFNQSALLRADFSSLVGISPDPFQAAAPQFCSVSSCLDFRGLDFSVDPSSHLVLHRLSTVRFFSVVSFRCQSSIFDSRIYLCRWFLVALLASVYPIFVVVLRFECAQEFPVGAAVRFGLLAPPVCSPAARFHFSSLRFHRISFLRLVLIAWFYCRSCTEGAVIGVQSRFLSSASRFDFSVRLCCKYLFQCVKFLIGGSQSYF